MKGGRREPPPCTPTGGEPLARKRERTAGASIRADLSLIAFPALLLLFLLAPLERGLFFPSALLPFEIEVAVLAAVVAVDRLLKREGPILTRPLDWAVALYALG